jgi:hypothetical protein
MSNIKTEVNQETKDVIVTKDGQILTLNQEDVKVLVERLMVQLRTQHISTIPNAGKSNMTELTPSEFVKTYGFAIAVDLVAQAKAYGSHKVGTGEHSITISKLEKYLDDERAKANGTSENDEPIDAPKELAPDVPNTDLQDDEVVPASQKAPLSKSAGKVETSLPSRPYFAPQVKVEKKGIARFLQKLGFR